MQEMSSVAYLQLCAYMCLTVVLIAHTCMYVCMYVCTYVHTDTIFNYYNVHVCMFVYVCTLLMYVSFVLQGCTQRSIARAKALALQEIQDAQCKVADALRRDWEVRVKLERAEAENQK